MRNSQKTSETWQFVVSDSILNSKFGPVLVEARRANRQWMQAAEVPEHVRQFLGLKQMGNNGRYFVGGFASKQDMWLNAIGVEWQCGNTRATVKVTAGQALQSASPRREILPEYAWLPQVVEGVE